MEDGNGVADVDVDDVGGDDVDDFEVDGVDVGDEFREEEVVRRHKGPSPKSLDSDENSKPKHTLFCHHIKICRDLRTFWKSSVKRSVFWVKNRVSWALLHGIIRKLIKTSKYRSFIRNWVKTST